MDAKLIPAHVNRVREERAREQRARSTGMHYPASIENHSPRKAEPCSPTSDLVARLFALTVTNDGPDPGMLSSKLWNTRAEFQAASPNTSIIDGPVPIVSISQITNSLSHLQIRSPASSTEASTPFPPYISCTAHNSPHPPTPPPASIVGGRGMTKKDRNQCSVKALRLLANIDASIHHCFRLLLDNSDDITSNLSNEVARLRKAVNDITRNTDTITQCKKTASDALDRLELELKSRSPTDTSLQSPVRVSNGRFLDTTRDILVDEPFSDHHYQSPISRLDAVAQVAVVISVICTTVMGIGARNGDFLMSALSLLLYLAFQAVQATSGDLHKHILKQVPLTIEGALAQLDIKCKTVPYAVCACHCTYPPAYPEGSSTPIYPLYCTHRPRPEDLCGESLLQDELNHKSEPKNIFHYHDFNDYLGHLLSRGDIEALMDHSCDELAAALSSPKPQFIKNIFEAQFFRNFVGPELGKLFIDRGDEGRYAFALHVDFFNPEGMSLRGARTSSGIISMACLNLPVDIHYKPENMYLAGIIPGPKQPSLENLNHYIRLLMKDLAISWERGVQYSRTANYPNGRVTRSAIALAVCDLPAARHLAAFARVGSHFFCSACSCYHKSNYGRVDFHNWVPRDKSVLRQYAKEWRDAPTSADRERLFKEHGVRYTELWCLPYWNPHRQLVVDSMHCILEGLVQHHVRNLLSLTNEKSATPMGSGDAFDYPFTPLDPETAATLSMSTKESAQVSAIQKLLVAPVSFPDDAAFTQTFMDKLLASLLTKNIRPLKFVYESLNCEPPKQTRLFKPDYAKALVRWVSRCQASHFPLAETLAAPTETSTFHLRRTAQIWVGEGVGTHS